MVKKEVGKGSAMDNSSGVAGVVLGIMSLISFSLISIPLGIIGLIFSLKQKKIDNNKWARYGKVINIIGIIIGIVVVILAIVIVKNNPEFLAQLQTLQGG